MIQPTFDLIVTAMPFVIAAYCYQVVLVAAHLQAAHVRLRVDAELVLAWCCGMFIIRVRRRWTHQRDLDELRKHNGFRQSSETASNASLCQRYQY